MKKIEDMKKELLELGISQTVIDSCKRKQELINLYNQFSTYDSTIDNVVTESQISSTLEEEIIEYGSEKWEDYVISQFKPEELYEGKYPRLFGLRRVARALLGNILHSKPVQTARTWDETGSAFCVYEIFFENYGVFGGAGDATPYNMEAYNIYPLAIAENRAEARAYRKALLLSVVAAEEMKETPQKEFVSVLSPKETTGEYNENDKMSSQQEVIIKTKCNQLSLDYDSLIKEKCQIPPTRKDAIDLISYLNTLQKDIK